MQPCNPSEALELMQTGARILVTLKQYEPSIFYLDGAVWYRGCLGEFRHPELTADTIADHFAEMVKNGGSLTAFEPGEMQ